MCPKDYALELQRLQQEEKREQRQQQKQAILAQCSSIREQNKFDMEQRLVHQKYRRLVMTLAEQDALLQELLTVQRIDLLDTQTCPKCRALIEKNGGCSAMRCTRCNTTFSWQELAAPPSSTVTPFLKQGSRILLDLTTAKEMVLGASTLSQSSRSEREMRSSP